MWALPDTVAVLGQGHLAAQLALRKVIRSKECRGPVLIYDALGRGAALLDEERIKLLTRRPVVWYDIADRRQPVSLFQIQSSPHAASLLSMVLRCVRAVSETDVSDDTLLWASQAGTRLASDGGVGLAALVRSLGSPEVRRWFIDTQPDAGDLTLLLRMLRWALRFPAVAALSEGPNKLSLDDCLRKRQTTWIEAKLEHLRSYRPSTPSIRGPAPSASGPAVATGQDS